MAAKKTLYGTKGPWGKPENVTHSKALLQRRFPGAPIYVVDTNEQGPFIQRGRKPCP